MKSETGIQQNNKKKRDRRQWSDSEDETLLDILVEAVNKGHRFDNGQFKAHTLRMAETKFEEKFLRCGAPEQEWNSILINGLTIGAGDISPEELYSVLKKRMERTLIRTEGGSYQQRTLTEYLKGIETRAHEIVQVLQGQGKQQ
ncbi:hypothetical protein L195_g029430 [Trifolium pratense]|uniref:Myb/SANT-like domain-containing protein n=1 Tax=Trifolium pratense TaxID=57577 RepID=A0A2K3L4S6_TRIPR|nr:hypothetical protein L195_g029430 [Trifolium pratense]